MILSRLKSDIQRELQVSVEFQNKVLDSVVHVYIADGIHDRFCKPLILGLLPELLMADIILGCLMTFAIRQYHCPIMLELFTPFKVFCF